MERFACPLLLKTCYTLHFCVISEIKTTVIGLFLTGHLQGKMLEGILYAYDPELGHVILLTNTMGQWRPKVVLAQGIKAVTGTATWLCRGPYAHNPPISSGECNKQVSF